MLIMSNPPAWSFWSASVELLKMRYCSAWWKGISCNWLPESFVKMLAEHVLCPLGSISLMVHLYLWCAEVSTRKGCFSFFFFFLRLVGNNPPSHCCHQGLILHMFSKQWKLGRRDRLMIDRGHDIKASEGKQGGFEMCWLGNPPHVHTDESIKTWETLVSRKTAALFHHSLSFQRHRIPTWSPSASNLDTEDTH